MATIEITRGSEYKSKSEKNKNVSKYSTLLEKMSFKSTPSKTSQFSSQRLPLYGPLDVKNLNCFLVNSKNKFQHQFESTSPFSVSPDAFDVLNLLGKGAFGKVMLVRDRSSKSFLAMKVLEKKHIAQMKQVSHALNEKRVLQSIDMPFAVRMEHFAKDNCYLFFYMPFITGGEMFTHLQKVGKFTEEQSRMYSAQVILALEYLHFLNLVFRDLKPENILLDHTGYLKLTDFGFCKLVTCRAYTFCGTPHYLAPEIIAGHGYTSSVDWWSLGVLIYEMNSGFPPFEAEDQMTMFKLILTNNFKFPPTFAPALKDLVSKLLQRDVARRYGNLRRGADDIKNHEYFKFTNWMDVFNRKCKAPFVPSSSDSGDVQLTHFPTGHKTSCLRVSNVNEYEDEFKDF